MFDRNMRRHHGPPKWIFFVVAMVAFVLVMGGVVMFLWNHIVADITDLREISWFEAMGLLILSKILFGKIGGPEKKFQRHRSKWKEKWMHMTEEERHAFKQRWKDRCGH